MNPLHSSFQTVMQRRVVPALMIAVSMGVTLSLFFPRVAPLYVIVIVIGIQLQLGLIVYLFYRSVIAPVASSVVLEDGALRVKRAGHEVVIPTSAIAGVRGRFGVSPETITIDLKEPSVMGSSITFIPPARFPSTKEHPMMATLRQSMAQPQPAR